MKTEKTRPLSFRCYGNHIRAPNNPLLLLDRMIATTHENTHKHCINLVLSHATSYVKVTCTTFDNM